MKTIQKLSRWFLLCLLMYEKRRGWGAAAGYTRVTLKYLKYWYGYFRGPRYYLAA